MGSAWKPVSRIAAGVGVVAAVLFWIHALTDSDRFLLLDLVNLPIHELGHFVFGIFGPGLGIWGGTMLQLMIPAACTVYFAGRGEATGTAFSVFWLGENLLYVATYVADAQAMLLPLVGGGIHDWNDILSGLGLLEHDAAIARIIRFVGWLTMVSSIVWFVSTARAGWHRTINRG